MGRPALLVRVVAIGVSTAFSLLLFAAGLQLSAPFRQIVAVLPVISVLLLIVWDIWAWRLPPFYLLHKRPNLRGLWSATLQPTKESHIPDGGNRGPIPAYVVIQQTFWSLSIRQFTKESISDSRAFFWQGLPGVDTERLAFIYANEPAQAYQHRSYPHLGNCTFEPARRDPQTMSGSYFTSRYTKGDMRLVLVDRTKGYADYSDVDEHMQKVGKNPTTNE